MRHALAPPLTRFTRSQVMSKIITREAQPTPIAEADDKDLECVWTS